MALRTAPSPASRPDGATPAGRPDGDDRTTRTPRAAAGAHQRVATVALVAAGGAMAVVVAVEGSPGGRVGRALATLVLLAAALLGERRLAGRARGLLLTAVGLVTSAVGLGIGPLHLAAGDPVPATAGLVALAAGVVLVVLGGRALVHGARLAVRIGAILAVLVATWVVWWSLGQAVAAVNVAPDHGPPARTPAAVGLTAEDVRFPARDGVPLAAWWVPGRDRAAVVVLPGSGSTRADVLDQGAVLARHGYGILLVDPRGHGASEGRAMDFGWYGDDDVAGAVAYLRTRADVDPDRIGALGESMGGEMALGAAPAVPGLRAVVAEGATARTAADWDWLSDAFGVRGAVQEQVQALTYGLADLLTEASPPTPLRAAAAAAAPRPVLLITAGTAPDEGRAAAAIAAGSPGTVATWPVAGAGHVGGLATDPAGWEARVTSFLDTALAAR